jgi:hypothetical protein
LRGRLSAQQTIYGEEMPFADPHTAAPGLWALRQDTGCEFEVSVASVDCSDSGRKALEAFVISDHRQKFQRSPTINFGRMPVGWRKSSGVSAKLKSEGKELRGGRCSEATPQHSPGIAPVGGFDTQIGSTLWCGHEWTEWCRMSDMPAEVSRARTGLYRIRGDQSPALIYIGQGKVLSRLGMHHKDAMSRETVKGRALASGGVLEASWVLNSDWSSVQLEELENDLIAAHYLATGEAPVAQFGGRDSIKEK